MNRQDLLIAGFRECPDSKKQHAEAFYQKRVNDNQYVYYFINVNEWPEFCGPIRVGKSFSADVNFYDAEGNHWYTITINDIQDNNVNWLENKAREFYQQMGFVPDIHNQF